MYQLPDTDYSNCPACSLYRIELSKAQKYIERTKEFCIERDALIAKLDEAMASPEQIAEGTKLTGGFVSSLYSTETGEEIVNRAITKLKQATALLREVEPYCHDSFGPLGEPTCMPECSGCRIRAFLEEQEAK